MVTLLLIEEKMGGGDAMKVGNGSRNLQGAPMPATAGQSSPASAAESSQGMPRVVFNAAPSFQEAKAATTDLKEAIDHKHAKPFFFLLSYLATFVVISLLLTGENMGVGGAMWNAMTRVASLGGVVNVSRNLQVAPMPPTAGQFSMRAPRPASAAVSSPGMPIVVFKAAPSFQEAQAAITDVKEAVDQICLSNSGDKHEASTEGSGVSVQSLHSELETKSCESALVPKHALQALLNLSASSKDKAFQALQYLSASPDAQNFVASLLSDSNVWDAISQDPELKDFLHSQDKGIELEESLDSDDKTSSFRSRFVHGFNYFKQNMKGTVAGMLRGASSYLYDLSEYLSPEKIGSDCAEKPNAFNTDHTNRKEIFMKLAVLVAMVVLFKRVPVFL